MKDPYTHIAEAGPNIVDLLSQVLEVRQADARFGEIRDTFLASIGIPDGARVLEPGCGTGAVCRAIVKLTQAGEVVGLDLSDGFLKRGRELAEGIPNLRFDQGDAQFLPYEDAEFDAVVFHSTLCHVPEPEQAVAEAFRVLRPVGRLGIQDGDYATVTVALGENDPLQACIDTAMNWLVNDPWVVRRLPAMVASAGFQIESFDTHGYVQTEDATYMLTLIDRGAQMLESQGQIDEPMAEALRSAARRRVEEGTFFGFISLGVLVATKAA